MDSKDIGEPRGARSVFRAGQAGECLVDTRTSVRYAGRMRQTATQLRANLYSTLDHVAATGKPVEIQRGDVTLQIIRVSRAKKPGKPRVLRDLVVGNPDDLVHMEWPWDSRK